MICLVIYLKSLIVNFDLFTTHRKKIFSSDIEKLISYYIYSYLYITVISFVIVIIIFLHGLGRLNFSGIDAFPSFPGTSTISSSSRFVVEGVFLQSGVVRSFKVVDPVLFVFESHVLYFRDL